MGFRGLVAIVDTALVGVRGYRMTARTYCPDRSANVTWGSVSSLAPMARFTSTRLIDQNPSNPTRQSTIGTDRKKSTGYEEAF